jgi:hypothetical protein
MEAGASEEKRWKQRRAFVAKGLGALGVAASLLISVIAFLESRHAGQEQTAVSFDAAASVNNLGSTPAGYAVRITLINASLRPIIVNKMVLKVGDTPIGPITGLLLGNRSAAVGLGDQPLADERPLPFALAERGAVTLTGLASFPARPGGPVTGSIVAESGPHVSRSRAAALGAAFRFCRELPPEPTGTAPIPTRPRRSDVKLEITYSPGGTKTVPVQISPGLIENTWRMKVMAANGSAAGIAFWRYDSAPSALRLLTVKVWRGDGGLMRSVSLPVAGSVTSEARFAPLPKGYYRAALLDEGTPVSIGHFKVPLRRDLPIAPQWQQIVNGQCELLREGKSVFIYPRKGFEGQVGWGAELRAAGLGS